MSKNDKPTELVGPDGSRMGRDADGAYILGPDGSCMRKGKNGSVIVGSDGTTLTRPAKA